MDIKIKDNSQLKLIPFTQLEYIESTGTQYIDTGISAPNGFKIEIEYQYTEIESNYRILVGSINSSSPYCRNMIGKDPQGRFFIGNKTGDWGISGVSTNKTKLIASTVDASTIIIDDSTVTMQRVSTYSDTSQSSYNLYVFGNNYANSVSQSVKIKLFYLKIYDYQDNIVREFIPAKDSNGVVCIYDTVSQTFFYNQGTGNFIAGPVVKYCLPENICLRTTTLYHENTPNVDGLQLLNNILNYQKTHQDEVKEYYYPTTQLWQDIITEYPDIVQYYNMNHKLCIPICESNDPEQFIEDFLQAIEDYPDITDVIVDNPEVVHSLVDTGYETWLQADGSSWIVTNYYINGNTDVECRACILNYNQNQNASPMLYGGAKNYTGTGGEMYGWDAFIFTYNNSNVIFTTSQVPINVKFKAETTAGLINISLDSGTTLTGGSSSRLTFTASVPTVVFALNRGSVDFKSATSKLSSLKFKEGAENKLWLVPIQNNGNPCMIDLLTGTKYLNQGTGNFTYSLEPKNA